MTKAQKAEQERAIEELQALIKPGDTLKCILRHVSRSGMQREISLYHGERCIDFVAARALGLRLGKHSEGIVIGGCGMDMGFHLVYELSRVLFPNGFPCTGGEHPRVCRATEHFNSHAPYRKGKMHKTDGGYAIRHQWM